MRNLIFFLSLFFILAVLPVLAVEPPSLENHQFYGYVFWNESQTAPKTVTATLSIASFPSAIKDTACVNKACSGKYGYSSDNILRVKGGKQGDLILFKVDSFLLKNYTYEPDQATQLNFSLFAGAVAPAINLSASVNLTACSSNWNCSDWNTCTEQKQSRTCNDLNKCNSSLINKTEEQSCGTAANNVPSQKKTTPKNVTAALGCPYYWDCSTWSECSTVGTQTRTCLRTDDCDQKLKDKKVPSIIALPKPNEKKVCSAVETTTPLSSAPQPQKFTPPTPPAAPKEAIPVKEESSFWTYILIIAIVVVLIAIGALVYFLKRGKGGLTEEVAQELSETYAKGAQRGLSEEEITEKLATRGWDENTLQKFLRSR
ncbi:MAG TPA: hypothetical protein VJA23_04195 [Candidatus Nanoarchaeia archaeon]|nr:hypothetical protein [Candidatus Nanoarchaeia archaeon]